MVVRMPNKNKKLEQIYQILNEKDSVFNLYDKEYFVKTCHTFSLDKENDEYVVAGSVYLDRERAINASGYIVVRVTKNDLKLFPKNFEKEDVLLVTKGLSVFVKRKDVGKVVLDSV